MADETEQTEIPVEAPVVAAPDIADETAPDPAPEPIEQDTSPPVVDTEAHHFLNFRQLWNGGERRAAYALVQAGQFAEDEFSALLNEFPDLLKIINS